MRWVRVYKSGIHHGEEGIVAGNERSGMINFSGCHLSCKFCYTPETSVHRFGEDYSAETFGGLVDDLIARGAANLNLVSPTHEWAAIEEPLRAARARHAHPLPLVLKISGYEGRALVARMAGSADVFVPDFKVHGRDAALLVNLPPIYGRVAEAAIEEMMSTHREPEYGIDGKLRRGIVVRHLLMPGFFDDSVRVVETLGGIGFRGPLNLMTYFIEPGSHRLKVAGAGDVARLAHLAEQQGMQILVDGKERSTRHAVHGG